MPTPMLPQRLREATWPWHARAERSGAMALLLRRRLSHGGYVRLLRSLLALYEAIEPALSHEAAALQALGAPARSLRRGAALREDLQRLDPEALRQAPADAALRYAARVDTLRGDAAHRLLAHVYVRYLGDLHGGQVLGALVREAFALHDGRGTRFYDFGDDDRVRQLRGEQRSLLAAARLSPAQADEVVDEAVWAFEAHVELFEQLAAAESAQEAADLLVQRRGAAG
ncbi:MAG: biliverdin-producing heme oxygenase [Rubrivivax sp.]